MRNTHNRLFILFTALLFLPGLLSGCNSSESAPTTEIVILHTNDTHGRVIGNATDVIGIDRIAAIHKNTANSILVDAGDTLHGLPVATLGRGADITAMMKEAGYDVMAIGNHEFNYGRDRLTELRGITGFPMLASNVTKNGSPFLDDTAIIKINGVKIGLFGIVTEETAAIAMPEYVSGLTFNDPVTTARQKSAYLKKQGVHVTVALCHLGIEPGSGTMSLELARKVPAIDIIIDGHSHTALPEGRTENSVLIAQAGQHGSYLGKVIISIDNGIVTAKTASLIGFEEAQNTAPDQSVADMLSEITANIEIVLGESTGESKAAMSSARNPGVRTQEMPIGNLVADAYREAAGAKIAIANGGDIRADIVQGVITKGDVISILPFGNTLMVKTVTPALLRKVLENGVSAIVVDGKGTIDHNQSPAGRFLQVSGFRFVYDPSASIGDRILSITLDDGRQLSFNDTTTTLALVGSNYIMTGGDHYTMLGDLPVLRELGTADEAFARYVKAHSPIDLPAMGRIVAVESGM
ncbi:MAG: 5'-nucleotidase C-terminal domain-containing protein [Treponema sp.]|jgi:5'-nucleotidase|nr:5'-nucleotidase C-terminal domain-containing protein [Treponema sp.]